MIDIAIKRYSRSLFEAALEQDNLEKVFQELGAIKQILTENKAFFKVLEYPMVTLHEKYYLIQEVFCTRFDVLICDFLKLLVEKDRIYLIYEIIADFEELYFDHKRIIKAQVVSAISLTGEVRQRLEEKLGALFGQTVVIDNTVDADIIGGLYIKAKDKVIDASLKGRLDKMKDSLLGDDKLR